MARRKRGFGQLRKLPSKRWQAFYTGPDTALHYAPSTFQAAEDAEAWLASERKLFSDGSWVPPEQRRTATAVTFGGYAARWLAERDLKPRTRQHYRNLLDHHILPRWGDVPLRRITAPDVRSWYAGLTPGRPAARTHAYSLFRTVLGTAVTDEIIDANPCHIRGAGTGKRVHKIRPATLDELQIIASHLPARYVSMLLLAVWCALRFGELTELRRRDIDLARGVIRVRRAVVRVDGDYVVGTPKSDAGVRDVAIPPHLIPALTQHLDDHVGQSPEALLFPAADGESHLAPSTLYRVFYPARAAAGRSDLRWHDLRHTGAVLAAQTGATLAELMSRMGHSTPQAALKYQHAAAGRDAEIAAALSRLVEAHTSSE